MRCSCFSRRVICSLLVENTCGTSAPPWSLVPGGKPASLVRITCMIALTFGYPKLFSKYFNKAIHMLPQPGYQRSDMQIHGR